MRWSPEIGDPSVAGWATVLAYVAAAELSLVVGVQRNRIGLERVFWLVSGLGLLFLAVNKQLDLQSFLTAAGRCVSQLQGWYDSRRSVQLAFVTGMLAATLIGGIGAFWTLRRTLHRTGVALLGLVLITGFVLVRAVGFHHFDQLIGFRVAGMRMNWILELGGIAVFALGCCKAAVMTDRQ